MTATPIAPDVIWSVIIGLAVGSFGLRFLFIGIVGDRPLPAWLMRHLRYTSVAIIPALITPLVVWPAATQGAPDAPRMLAALATIAVGVSTKNVLLAMLTGAGSLWILLYLLG
jgi:branched chain amino acid efflux pump